MSGGRPWAAEEDARLCTLLASGMEYRRAAKRLNRSPDACKCRASFLGVKLSREAVLANRKAGRDRFWKNPKRVERWRKRVSKQFTPLDRQIRAEELRQRNLAGKMMRGRHHTPEVRARISAANKGRKLTPEHRAKIAEGRRLYWERWRAAKRKEVEDVKAAMLADKRHLQAFGAWGEVQSAKTETVWCAQCERQVSATAAASCASPFCKAKALAA